MIRRPLFPALAVAISLSLSLQNARAAEKVEFLQNWSDKDREWFYWFNQGSQVLPYEWFLALEVADSDKALFIADGLARYGYIPGNKSIANPDGLPVGFAKDPANDRSWVGLNCAACHTARIQFGKRILQVDGAGGNGDLNALIDGLASALDKTSRDDAKFKRFAKRVKAGGGESDEKALRKELASFVDYFNRFSDDSRPREVQALPGRTDAFRLIFNRVFSINLNNLRANTKTPEAPVRYPRLWGTHQFERVQWTGNLENSNLLQRLGRNVGQVLGVFARMPKLGSTARDEPDRYRSTARILALLEAESYVARIPTPVWPGGTIDEEAATRGKEIFFGRADASVNCGACHKIDTHENVFPTPRLPISSLGTDARAAALLACERSLTGPLEGQTTAFNRTPIAAEEPTIPLLSRIVIETVLASAAGPGPARLKQIEAAAKTGKYPIYELRTGAGACDDPSTLTYKAGPLRGIWATAPYLHNGSVPTLDDLLRPVKSRPGTFRMNVGIYDEQKVGIDISSPGGPMFDTSIRGNSNGGHEGAAFGTELPDGDRRNLIEFLKSL